MAWSIAAVLVPILYPEGASRITLEKECNALLIWGDKLNQPRLCYFIESWQRHSHRCYGLTLPSWLGHGESRLSGLSLGEDGLGLRFRFIIITV